MKNEVAVNPFSETKKNLPVTAQAQSDQSRAIQEIQAALVIAKRFERNQEDAMDRILKECMRPQLAEAAEYAYPRGGQTVTGPSIRLAESVARCWGNIDYGIRELEQVPGASQMEAYAWDLETNTRARRVFTVKHIRHTKRGQKKLTDPRDIYEMAANQGARRMRACILQLIPGDVVDAALKQVQITLKSNIDVTKDAIKKMVEAFESIGISEDLIKKRFNKKVSALLPAEYLDLRRIYASLKDGMSRPHDWFDVADEEEKARQATVSEINDAIEEPSIGSPEPIFEELETHAIKRLLDTDTYKELIKAKSASPVFFGKVVGDRKLKTIGEMKDAIKRVNALVDQEAAEGE